jgi:hypothetical protein
MAASIMNAVDTKKIPTLPMNQLLLNTGLINIKYTVKGN